MERRARIKQTFRGYNSSKGDYNIALGLEFAAMSRYAENVVRDKPIKVQQRVRVRLLMDIYWTEMQ
eukprot:4830622-Karenia_brevis.AAC.1